MSPGARGGPRVLVVATKCPWPPTDGGRLVLAETLRALVDAGAQITLVSPPPASEPGADPRPKVGSRGDGTPPILGADRDAEPDAGRDAGRDAERRAEQRAESGAPPRVDAVDGIERIHAPHHPPHWIATLLRAGRPATIVRQINQRALEAVERLVAAHEFDVAHAEQIHTLPMLEPARRRGIPIVLRAQNVESDLWRGAARALPLAAPWLLFQAALLRRWEGHAVASATVTAALTAPDAARLRELARTSGRVVDIAAPFPASLPAADPVPGGPAIVLAGGGWIPNRDGARWFVRHVWPLVLARLPAARLHLFGAGDTGTAPSVTEHPSPPNSIALFPERAIHVVPLRVGSGVRMKILEAWARGVPVVATPAAAAGLQDGGGRSLLREQTPEAIALAIGTLADDPELRQRLASEGRRRLALHHDPVTIGARWLELYREAAGR